jgi:DUF1365 family protein
MESSRMNTVSALASNPKDNQKDSSMFEPKIGFGQVRHTRLKPVQHAFHYPTYFLMLPMRTLAKNIKTTLKRNRWAALSFYDKDHGDGRSNG